MTLRLIACSAAVLGLVACSHAHSHLAAHVPPVGSVAVLGMGASHGEAVGEPCLPSRSELDALLEAKAAARGAALGRAADDAIPLAPRLRVRILARAARDREVRLRLLDGPWAGTACWADGSIEGLFAVG